MTEKINLVNRDPTLHLRDARHAHQFYTENGHLFSPKVKFLYHVVFDLSNETGLPYTSGYDKEIGVLAKTCDLPQYRVNIDTRKQYNRNRNFQTGINYEEVKIVFHDDNMGVTTRMLEEYYRYYYRDGNKNNGTPIDYKDFSRTDLYKYSEDSGLPRYGYDSDFTSNNKTHFFKNIIVYQMARQEWTSFTLVNPLITAIGHDTLDYSDGAGMMENTISVAYEAVMYNRGFVVVGDEPSGFGNIETRYDTVFSPLIQGASSSDTRISPTLAGTEPEQESTSVITDIAEAVLSVVPSITSLVNGAVQSVQGGIQGISVPNIDVQNADEAPVAASQPEVRNIDPDDLYEILLPNDDDILVTAAKQNLAAGNISSDQAQTLNDWDNLPEVEQQRLMVILLTEIQKGNPSVVSLTSKIVGASQ